MAIEMVDVVELDEESTSGQVTITADYRTWSEPVARSGPLGTCLNIVRTILSQSVI
jgi:hypothetical protein